MKKWFDKQSPVAQLLLAFIQNCIVWLLVHTIFAMLWPEVGESRKTIDYMLFHAISIGFFWTLFYKWKLIKLVFSKKGVTQ